MRLSKWTSRFGTPFILNREVTLALYVMSVVLILVSSLVLYLYGYGRLVTITTQTNRAIFSVSVRQCCEAMLLMTGQQNPLHGDQI